MGRVTKNFRKSRGARTVFSSILIAVVLALALMPLASAQADTPSSATTPAADTPAADTPAADTPTDASPKADDPAPPEATPPSDDPATPDVATPEDTTPPVDAPVNTTAPASDAPTDDSAPVVDPPAPPAPTDDGDGVDAAIENAAPHAGDNNEDGIADAEQSNVASLPAAVDVDNNGALDDYATIVAPDDTSLRGVRALKVPASNPPPQGVQLPYGLFEYEVVVAEVGDSADVTYLLPDGEAPIGVHMLQNGRWSDFSANTEIDSGNDAVTLTLRDGGAGDETGVANGVIEDPSGPSTADLTITVIKQTSVEGVPGTFTFTLERCTTTDNPCGAGDWAPVANVGPGTPVLADNESFHWTGIETGRNYRLLEVVPANWASPDSSCTGSFETGTTNGEIIRFTALTNDTDCTFTNRRAPGTATIRKNVTPDALGSFNFTLEDCGNSSTCAGTSPEVAGSPHALADNGEFTFTGLNLDPDDSGGNWFRLLETNPGPYAVSVSCLGGRENTAITDGRMLRLDDDPANNEDWIDCTVTNSIPPAELTINKDVPGSTGTDFNFTASGGTISPTNFSLDDDGGANETLVYSNLVGGVTYTFTETAPPGGWQFDSIQCTGLAGGSTAMVSGNSVQVTLVAGDTGNTCTFNNSPVPTGTITVHKGGNRANPAGTDTAVNYAAGLQNAVFEFRLSGSADPWLTLCTTDANGDCTSAVVPPGDYDVREKAAPVGWSTLANLTYGGDSSGGGNQSHAYQGTVTVGTSGTSEPQVQYTNDSDDTESHRFVNVKDDKPLPENQCGIDIAMILDVSGSIGRAPSSASIYQDAADQFITALDGTPTTLTRIVKFSDGATVVNPGNFPINLQTDAADAHTEIAGVYSSVGGGTNWDAALKAMAGSGAEVVVMVTDGNPTTWDGSPNGGGGDITLDDLAAGIASANSLKAESTIIAVGVGTPPAVTATNLAAISGPGRFFTSNLDTIKSELAALANQLCGSRIHVQKWVGGQLTDGWTFAGAATGANVSYPKGQVTGGGSNPPLPTGEMQINLDNVPVAGATDVTVTETLKPGYSILGRLCQQGSFPTPQAADANNGGVAINVGTVQRNQDWYCTFVNTQQGSISVVKDTVPNGPADFSFTANNSASPANFSLDDDANGTLSNTQLLAGIVDGQSYVVTETSANAAGFSLTNLVCTGGGGDTTVDIPTGVATIGFDAGETIECKYTNTQQGSISVVKDTVPNGPADFSFTATNAASPANFSLDDDANGTLSNTQLLAGIVDGQSYVVTETSANAAGFSLTNLVCTGGGGDTTVDIPTGVATIGFDAGETIECKYTNTQQGSISVVKDTVPNGPADFSFTATNAASPANFSLDDDANGTLSNTQLLAGIVDGQSYVVTETSANAAGFSLTNLVCTGGGGDTTVDIPTGVATIGFDAGETIECKYTNTQQGSISVVKDTVPNGPADFSFTATNAASPANFSLDDDANGTLSNTQLLAGIVDGQSYVVTETSANAAGFSLTNLVCTGGGGDTTVDIPTGVATIGFDAGETIECKYTNTQQGSISVVKDTVPNGPADFSFTATNAASPANFSLDDDANGTLSNTQLLAGIVDGQSYVVTETSANAAGFSLTNLVCTGGGGDTTVDIPTGVATIGFDAGETIECKYTNTQQGSISVVKDTVPNGPADFSFTATNAASPANFSLDDDANGTLSNTQLLAGIVDGQSYVVTETSANAAGFSLTNLVCTGGGGDTTVDIPTGVATIGFDAGETIECKYTNTQQGSISVVKDTVPNGPADFSFTATNAASPANFSLDDDANGTLSNTQLLAGIVDGQSYVVTETSANAAGFSLTNLVCTGGGGDTTVDIPTGVATIGFDAGETIECKYTNTQQGSISVVKDTVPNGPADFSFTATNAASPANFSLDDDANGTLSNTQLLAGIVDGQSYVVTETSANAAGFSLTNLVCTGGGGDTTVDIPTGVATIGFDAGETIECKYTNTQQGSISVVKDTVPNGPADFSFTATNAASPANFSLDDDANGTLSNTQLLAGIVDGQSYVVTETSANAAGFSLTNLVCTGGGGDTTVDIPTGVATIGFDAGETIECKYTNTQQGSISVVKDTVPNGPADFSFTATNVASPANFSLDDDANGTLSNTQLLAGIVDGQSYVVTETSANAAGFSLTNLVCTGGGGDTTVDIPTGVATIGFDAGETIECKYTNTQQGSISVVKDTVPNGPADFSFTATNAASPANFSLDDDANGTLSNTQLLAGIVDGQSYVVTETSANAAGFSLTNLVCTGGGGDTTVDIPTGVATIGFDAGETIECKYTNTQQGSISVVKDTVPNGPADFSFTATNAASPANFSLDDDANGTLSNTQLLAGIVDGQSYVVTETSANAAGFSLTNLVCTGGGGDTTVDIPTGVATIGFDAGETIECKYTNTQQGSISVVKDTVPNGPADFSFTATNAASPANFSLDDDANGTLSNTQLLAGIVDGQSYVVTETSANAAGFSLTNLVCTGGGGDTTVDIPTGVATIGFDAGETIECKYTNTQQGSISVVKDTVPNGPADFSFTATNAASPANFSLDDDANGTLSNTQLLAGIVDGQSYVVTETSANAAGFSLTNLVCTGGGGDTTVDIPTGVATIGFDAGETIECKYTNTQQGSISVVKDTVPNGPADFSFTATNAASPANFSLDDDANGTLSNTQLLAGIVDGQSYVVTETSANAAGFSLTNLVCTGGGGDTTVDIPTGVATIGFDAGETIECKYTNTQQGSISVVKDTVPNGPADFSFTATNAASPANFSLDDDANGTLSNTQLLAGIVDGQSYVVTETSANAAGFSLTNLVCTGGGGDTTVDIPTGVATIGFDAGETIECKYTNTQQGSISVVKDTVPNGPADFSFTATNAASPANFSLDDDANGTLSNTQLLAGIVDGQSYVVTETSANAAGFSLTNLVCTGGGGDTTVDIPTGVATIGFDAGETIECKYTNTQQGSISVVKDTVPNGPADFSFTATNAASPANFSLDDDANGTLSNTQLLAGIVDGQSYVVTETSANAAGFSLTNLVCTGGGGDTTVDIPTGVATIGFDAGETIECKYTNTQQGSISVVKDTVPNGPADFSFTATNAASPANFSLDDDANGTLSNTQLLAGIVDGQSYVVTETSANAAGFSLTNLVCTGGGGDTTVDIPTGVATIGFDAGETIECKYTNTQQGSISVVKDTVPNGPADFSFTATNAASPANFSLDDDANGTLSNTQLLAGIVDGQSYVVTETSANAAGFSLTNLVCTGGGGDTTVDIPTGVATIGFDAGETIECKYTNTQQGSISVVKDTVPNGPADFSFTATNAASPANFSLDDDANGTLSNTQLLAGIVDGQSYVVTETSANAAGFSLTNLVCTGGGGDTTVDIPTGVATIGFDAGETIECKYTNTQQGSISVVKDTVPNGPADFSFTATNAASPANFSLDDDANGTLSNTQLLAGIVDGQSYVVTETSANAAGFSLTNLVCTGGGGDTTVDIPTGVATIGFDAGETIECKYTNTQQGSISVVKDTVPNGPADFSFTATNAASPANFSLDDDANGTLSNTQLLAGIVDGQSYVVTETSANAAGFSLTNLVCTGGGGDTTVDIPTGVATIGFDAGETIECKYTNTQQGSISVVKDTVPQDAQNFTFNTTNLGGQFTLDDDGDGTLSDTKEFLNLAPGTTYTVTEIPVTGWKLVTLQCTGLGEGDTSSSSTGTVSVALKPGQVVECTYTNQSPDLGVVKSDDPDPVVAGTQLTYTVIATNHGPADATGVVVTDTLDPNTTFVSTSLGADCSHAAGVVTCELGDLANGDFVEFTITVLVSPGAPVGEDTLNNVVDVEGNQPDWNPENNHDEEPTSVISELDLAITKTDGGARPVAGQGSFTYTLSVDNLGPSDAQEDATVIDVLPPEVTFLSFGVLETGISCDPPVGQIITCTIDKDLLDVADDPVTIPIEVSVKAGTPSGDITNKTIVTSPDDEAPCVVTEDNITCDPSDTNNYAQAVTPVTAVGGITIPAATPPAALAFTGSAPQTIALFGGLLLGTGAIFLVASRRRRKKAALGS